MGRQRQCSAAVGLRGQVLGGRPLLFSRPDNLTRKANARCYCSEKPRVPDAWQVGCSLGVFGEPGRLCGPLTCKTEEGLAVRLAAGITAGHSPGVRPWYLQVEAKRLNVTQVEISVLTPRRRILASNFLSYQPPDTAPDARERHRLVDRPHPRGPSPGGPGCSFSLPLRPGLLEIKAVALRTVAIKGVHSVRYLCMGADGKMQGLLQYSEEDCAFQEEIRPDGYNVYRSQKHRLPVSLSSAKQRQLYKNRGFLPLSHFLPMLPMAPEEPEDLRGHLESDMFSSPLETDSMDPFGLVTGLEAVRSPSFEK
uniref:Fibroblast growth factor n=2 Tax=Mandrillus leucophaeus TaxID=9568 RepID=A0A2K6A8G4_MANLE